MVCFLKKCLMKKKIIFHLKRIPWKSCFITSEKIDTTKSSSAAGRSRRRLGNASTCAYGVFWYLTKSSSAAGRTRRQLGNTRTSPYGALRHITKSLSAAGCTRRQLGNTRTSLYGAFRHITKLSSAAGCTRRRLGNTRTSPYGAFRYITKSLSAAGRTRRRLGNTITCPYGDDDLVICRNAAWYKLFKLVKFRTKKVLCTFASAQNIFSRSTKYLVQKWLWCINTLKRNELKNYISLKGTLRCLINGGDTY